MQGPPPNEASTSGTGSPQPGGQQHTYSSQAATTPHAYVPLQHSTSVGPQTPYAYQFSPRTNTQPGAYVWNSQQQAQQPAQYTYHHYQPYQWTNSSYTAAGAYPLGSPVSLQQTDGVPRPALPSSATQSAPQTAQVSPPVYPASQTAAYSRAEPSAAYSALQPASHQQVPPVKQPTPPPPPPPPFQKHWDTCLKTFLEELGLTQAMRGFEADMLIMNPEWEQSKVPSALVRLTDSISRLSQDTPKNPDRSADTKEALDERKLEYVHFASGVDPRTPTTITKSISRFLAQSRARNDSSNKQEFLLNTAEKRRRLEESGILEKGQTATIPSCARTDARTQNRDVQMKYDIAKNEDGPLRKTMKPVDNNSSSARMEIKKEEDATRDPNSLTAERHPALDERLKNIETHVAVRYVPLPPRSLLDRVKFLEDHLLQLEKEYPPWAALHFNQPHRGWPPPPRPTPIIVPSHLTSSNPSHFERKSLLLNMSAPETFRQGIPTLSDASLPEELEAGSGTSTPKHKAKASGRNVKSSLHRAVMERLEVQKAINDLAGASEAGASPQ